MKPQRSASSAVLGLIVALLGIRVFSFGYGVVASWESIGAAYAACGIAFLAAGAGMVIGGLWALASLGKQRIALWTAAAGSVVFGSVLVAGVLTYVIPCSGPS